MRSLIIRLFCFLIVFAIPVSFAISIVLATVLLWRHVFP